MCLPQSNRTKRVFFYFSLRMKYIRWKMVQHTDSQAKWPQSFLFLTVVIKCVLHVFGSFTSLKDFFSIMYLSTISVYFYTAS